MQTTDPQLQLLIGSNATPQIMNDIATARKMLRGIDNSDIEISQLIVLISESAAAGDLVAAKDLIDRAVSKTDTTPYLRSEAQRYQGRYYYLQGEIPKGKESFEAAISSIGALPGSEGTA